MSLISRARSHRGHRGQSVVEFALLLPVFLLFFAGVLDLGRIAATQVMLSNAAREGAVQAGRTPTDFDSTVGCSDGKTNLIYCRVKFESVGASIQPTDVAVTCKPGCTHGMGHLVTVKVQGSFRLLTPLLASIFGGKQQLTLVASSTQNIETLPTSGIVVPTASPTPTPTPSPSASASPTPTPLPTPISCTTPSAGFTHTTTPKSGQSPVTLTVVDTSTSPGCAITSWTWSWGDGTTSSGKVPGPHTYVVKNRNLSGFYEVTLRVTNATSSNTTGTVQITVK